MSDEVIAPLIDLADRIVKMAKDGGATVAECIVRQGAELFARVRMGETELVEEAGHKSAGLRVMKGKQVALTSTSDLSDRGIERFVKDALELADLAQEDPFAGPADPKLLCDPSKAPDLDLYDPECGKVDAAQAIGWAKKAEDAAREDKRIVNSQGSTFTRTAGGFGLSLSSGFRGGYQGSYASLYVQPIAEEPDGKKRRGYHWTARRHLATLDKPEDVGHEAARRTVRLLGSKTVATCEVPVVFDPDSARAILGLLAECVSGGMIWRKSSYLVGRENTRVASDLVTVIDDPLIPRAPGSRGFDGEGLASRKNVVVEKGILKTYLCDSYSARKLGRESTASATRSAGGGVGGGTTNFVLQPGSDSNAAIVKATKRGLYVTEMMGFGFNAITGDFSRGAAGFWIENGELAYPVSEITISSNVDEMWKTLDAVGSDLDMRTAIVSPTIRIAKMVVAGGAGA